MNELEQVRAQLWSIRTLVDGALAQLEQLLQHVSEPEIAPAGPRWLGDTDPPPEQVHG